MREALHYAALHNDDGRRVKISKHAGGGVIKSVDDDVDLSMRFSHDYRDVERRRK